MMIADSRPTALGALCGQLTFRLAWCCEHSAVKTYGDTTFAAAGPRVWNSLLVQLRNPVLTYGLFRRQLKGRDIVFEKHERGALWRLICGASENTYLLTYLMCYTGDVFMLMSYLYFVYDFYNK